MIGLTHDAIKLGLQQAGLSEFTDRILTYVKPSIYLSSSKVSSMEEMPLGASRIGGLPDLPAESSWLFRNGRPSEFLAQINLADIADMDETGLLPREGMLWFFYDGREYEDKPHSPYQTGSETIIYAENPTDLIRREYPEGLEDWQRYEPCAVTFTKSWVLPRSWGMTAGILKRDVFGRPLFDTSAETSYSIAYDELCDRWEPDDKDNHHFLGYPDPIIQDDPIWSVISEAEYQAPERDKLTEEWVHLFQISSDYYNSGMLWADISSVYYIIRKTDLHAKRFDRICCIMQNS